MLRIPIPLIVALLMADPVPSFDKLRADYFRDVAKANALQATFQRSLTDSQKKAQEEIGKLMQAVQQKHDEIKKLCPGLSESQDGDISCPAEKK